MGGRVVERDGAMEFKKIVAQARAMGINTHKFEGLSRKGQVRRMKRAMAERMGR